MSHTRIFNELYKQPITFKKHAGLLGLGANKSNVDYTVRLLQLWLL